LSNSAGPNQESVAAGGEGGRIGQDDLVGCHAGTFQAFPVLMTRSELVTVPPAPALPYGLESFVVRTGPHFQLLGPRVMVVMTRRWPSQLLLMLVMMMLLLLLLSLLPVVFTVPVLLFPFLMFLSPANCGRSIQEANFLPSS